MVGWNILKNDFEIIGKLKNYVNHYFAHKLFYKKMFARNKSFITECTDCLYHCSTLGKDKKYCNSICADYKEYFDCQVQCIASKRDEPQDCIQDLGCKKKCNEKCKKFATGRNFDSYF